MRGILVLGESRRGKLCDASLEAVGAAVAFKEELDGPVCVAMVGADASRLLPNLGVTGVDELIAVDAHFDSFEAHVHCSAVEALIEAQQPALVILSHSIDAIGFAPALAARLGLGLATDVVELGWDGGIVVTRSMHGGKVNAELDFPGKENVVITLRPGSFAAPDGSAESFPVRAMDVEALPRTEPNGFIDVDAAIDVDITGADFLLSVGRGIEDRDEIEQFEKLADLVGATLCASRPLVDSGWISSARQVGQSGKTVKPKVYLAFGISGAVQHLAGMRDAETIIAVNTDAEAPIFGVAHFGTTVDMFDLADELEQRFEA